VDEIASELDIPLWLAAKHIKYATHFLSVYDLARHDDDDDDSGDYGDDVYDYIAEQTMFEPPDTALRKKYRHEYLHRLFQMLSEEGAGHSRQVLRRVRLCAGAAGRDRHVSLYENRRGREGTNRALGKLQKLMREYPNPYALAEAAVRRAVREYNADEECSTPQCAWYEAEQK
jgi:hypothetical protein